MTDFEIKQNDTSPAIVSYLQTPDGEPEDLTGANVLFKMVKATNRELVIDSTAEIVDAANGQVRYKWSSEDLSEPGNYLAEWEVTWASGTEKEQISTFPNYEFISIYVFADNG
ncbi:phage BppU N-terminal domain [Halorubrum tailed virus 25]|uniref:Phage BppU N-terminal domain n=1 Tax=Halorubrum tailed virus 25 TaxID=2878006 RepID=A0AAE8XYU3_9CAUD|nr:phage BppU N-terminal domain [Halorubrum tailed virus 25]UBF22589.1 phage BppU N-terminal domain [Halorubrum tailed virus 25]